MAPSDRGAVAALNWPNAVTVSRLLLLAVACAIVGVLSGANYIRYTRRPASA